MVFESGTSLFASLYSKVLSKIDVSRVPTGLEDVSKYPNLIAELMMRGWSDEDLIKISRGNILRVMRDVEEFARKSKEIGEKPREEWIPDSDVAGVDCRTG